MAEQDTLEQWFEAIWAYREETLYARWFGNTGAGIYCLRPQLFQQLGAANPDPRWLHHGVFQCPPHGDRTHWAYITSGLSNPWGQDPSTVDKKAFSGLGLEYLFYAPTQVAWGIDVLSWLSAVTLLVAAGTIRGDLPEVSDRIPLGMSLDATSPTPIRNILLTRPPDLPERFQLDSGVVDLMLCVGITDAERDYTREQGTGALLEKLKERGAYPVTDPKRNSEF